MKDKIKFKDLSIWIQLAIIGGLIQIGQSVLGGLLGFLGAI